MSDTAMKVVEVLAPVLMAALTWAAALLANWLRAKVKNVYLQGLFLRLEDAVLTAVKEANQVMVDALKDASSDGVLTEEEKAAVKAKVIAVVKSHLGVKGLAELAKILGLDDGALTALIGSKIEATVYDIKAREAAIANPPAPPQG